MPIDVALLSPGEYGAGGELRSVVGDDQAWLSTALDQIRQLARHALGRNRGVRDRRQTLARHVVKDVQDTKPPADGELIADDPKGREANSSDQRPVARASTRIGAGAASSAHNKNAKPQAAARQ